MDEDTIAKIEFIDPILNFLNNFGVFSYYLISRMINKDNEKGLSLVKLTPRPCAQNTMDIVISMRL